MKISIGPNNPLMLRFGNWETQHFGVQLANGGNYLSLTKDRREIRIAPDHFVHAFVLAKDFDQLFSPLVPSECDGKLVVDYSHPGVLQTYASSGLQFEMASFPEEEDAIADYFKWYRPRSGDVVFDVGAHCGVSTYYFSKDVGPTGRVIAFEPDPTNFGLLQRNIERHNLSNVLPVQVAIAATREPVRFACSATIGSGMVQYVAVGASPTRLVDAMTLADAFGKWGAPQFCKIDIEGAELEVIGSSADLLGEHTGQFVLDTNHTVGGSLTCGRIEEMFRASGYRVESSTSGIKTTWAAKP